MKANQDILGFGLRFPLVRSATDFQASAGEDLVFSSVPYILETQANSPGVQGEIPWDSSFGSQLERLKHKNIVTDSDVLNELAREYVVEALAINEPRLVVRAVRADFVGSGNGNRLEIFLRVGVIDEDTEANDVRIRKDTEIAISLPF